MRATTDPAVLPLSRRGAGLTDAPISWLMAQALEVPGLLSLAAGLVDHETLPWAELAELASGLLGDPRAGREALQYGTTAGDPALRRALRERLGEKSGAPVWERVTDGDVLLTTGSQQLLYLLAEVLLEKGDLVLVENPSYFVFVGALESFAARLVGVECDGEGILPEALDRSLSEIAERGELERVKLVYIMSYSQNPTGATLSAPRRPLLWEVFSKWKARGLGALLLEDAAYRDLRFPGVEDIPPLFELQSENESVCYTESFSKVLAPGLRLGFGVMPAGLGRVVLRMKSHHDFGSSNLSQKLVQRALSSGVYDTHVEALRGRYRDKCRRLLEVLRAELGDGVRFVEPTGGLYLWVVLPPGLDTGAGSALFLRALEEKVLYVPGEMCAIAPGRPGDPNRRSLRLCFAYPPDSELVEAGARLARAIRAVL